jgi:dolichol-phosphate mannosyltransferase
MSTPHSFLAVIPTYNEQATIECLIDAIFKTEKQYAGRADVQILVVDDHSPDGTGAIVRGLQAKYPALHIIQGKKSGLGAAYKRGFNHARKNLDFDSIIMMDADMSHDPTDLPKLIDAILDGADVAIGSRYIVGGLIPGNWPLIRIINTRVANNVARYIGGIETDIADLTGGFKAFRRHVLETIKVDGARLSGYSIQLFLSNAFSKHGFRIAEVPISFQERSAGESKLRVKDILEFFKTSWQLNPTSPFKQLFSYALIGIGALSIELAVF